MTAPTSTPEQIFGITAEEFAEVARRAAPFMPFIPVPSRWTTLKNWFLA